MIMLFKTLSPNDKAHGISAASVKLFKLLQVIYKVIEVGIAPKQQFCLLIPILRLECFNFYISFRFTVFKTKMGNHFFDFIN